MWYSSCDAHTVMGAVAVTQSRVRFAVVVNRLLSCSVMHICTVLPVLPVGMCTDCLSVPQQLLFVYSAVCVVRLLFCLTTTSNDGK